MAASGIGVQPVEGRWDAAIFDGDPAQAVVGVWDGDAGIYQPSAVALKIQGTLKRAATATLVRAD